MALQAFSLDLSVCICKVRELCKQSKLTASLLAQSWILNKKARRYVERQRKKAGADGLCESQAIVVLFVGEERRLDQENFHFCLFGSPQPSHLSTSPSLFTFRQGLIKSLKLPTLGLNFQSSCLSLPEYATMPGEELPKGPRQGKNTKVGKISSFLYFAQMNSRLQKTWTWGNSWEDL